MEVHLWHIGYVSYLVANSLFPDINLLSPSMLVIVCLNTFSPLCNMLEQGFLVCLYSLCAKEQMLSLLDPFKEAALPSFLNFSFCDMICPKHSEHLSEE